MKIFNLLLINISFYEFKINIFNIEIFKFFTEFPKPIEFESSCR